VNAIKHSHEWKLSETEYDDGRMRITVFMCERCGTYSRVIEQNDLTECINDTDCDLALVGSIMER
jgi:hypothetical protein